MSKISAPHSRLFPLGNRLLGKISSSSLGIAVAMSLGVIASTSEAATETWVGTTSDWGTASNWNLPSVPVAADTAIFNTGTGLAVSLNGVSRNIRFLNFDSNAGSFTFGATGSERLILTSAGGISILSTVTGTNLTETFAAPITLAGSVAFSNARLDVGTSLQITGNITNSAVATLTINGAGTGTGNLISGNISDGTGVQSVTLSHTAGAWTLSGTNSYSGLTTISGAGGTTVMAGSNSSSGATTLSNGTLQLASGSNGGLASGALTLTAGTLQAVGATRSLSNAVTMTAVTVSGTQSLNLNGKLTGATGASRTLTSSIANGGTLTLGDVDINSQVGTAQSLTIAGTGNTTVSGTIANGLGTTTNNSLVITNTGTTTLSNASTYTGSTTLSAGTVVLGNKASLGTGNVILNATTLSAGATFTGTNAVSNNYGSTASGGITSFIGTNSLELSGVNTSNVSHTFNNNIAGGTLTLSGTQILSTSASDFGLTLTGSGNTVISGAITNGTGGSTGSKLIYTGNGLLTLSGVNTYSGSTAITNGKVNVTGALGNTVVSVNGGGSLGGSGNGTTTGVIGTGTGGSVVVAGGTGAATRGTIDLVDNSIGTFTINGTSGANTLTLGSTTAGSNAALNFETGTNSTDVLAVGNSGKVLLNLGGASINLTALAGQTLANGTYNLITYAASSTFTGAFNLASANTVGGSRYLLNNTSTAEQLIVTNNVATGNAYWTGLQGSTWESFTSGTSNFVAGPSSTADAGVPSSASNVFFTANSGTNLTTTIQNDYVINSLNYTGVGTSGTGATTIAGSGTITLNATSTNGNTAGVGITIQAGSGTQTIGTKIALGQSQTWVNNSTINLQLNNANTTIAAGQSLTLTGTAAGFSFITSNSILGSGTLVVNTSASFGANAANNSSFNGTILLNSGNISLNGGNSASSSPNMLGTGVLIINGGTITAGGNIANGGGVTGITSQVWNGDWTQFSNGKTLVLGGTVSLGTAAGTTRNVTVNGNTAIFSATGAISDGTFANSITKSGLGTMRLTGVNTFSGTMRIAAGGLAIDANSGNTTLALQNSTLDMNAVDTGTLSFGSSVSTTINAATFGGLKGSRNLGLVNTGTGVLSSAIALTIGGNNSSQTYSGTLSGALGSVTKVGSGTQIFTAANTYTGATTVNAGTLLVNGSGVSAVQVNAGTLGGTGTISNTVTVADGATVAPGSAGAGILSTGDLTLSGSTSTLAMEISGTGAGAYDRLNVTGAVNLDGNGQIALNLLSYTPTAGDLFFLVVNDGSDAISGTLFGLAQGATFSSGGFNWQISYNADAGTNAFSLPGTGNDLAIIAVVPEPQTWALLGAGATMLLVFRRRRQS